MHTYFPLAGQGCTGCSLACVGCPDVWQCRWWWAMIRSAFITLLLSALAFPLAADAIEYQSTPGGTVWSVNLGSVAVCLALIAGFWKLVNVLGQFHKDYLRIVSDVNILMNDYCERKGIERRQLPRYVHQQYVEPDATGGE
jgi:hypothetical protein